MNTILSRRTRSFRTFICLMFGAIGTVATVACARAEAQAGESKPDCHVGTYRLRDGAFVDIGAENGGHLRWRREDGTTGLLSVGKDGRWTSTLGWTGRPDGKSVLFSDCGAGRIAFDGVPGQRVALEVTETTFDGAGVRLAGRLVMPKGDDKVPIVVLVHGSEDLSGIQTFALQRQFPAEGIGVFVYDKRGTGASTGVYTQNYLLLVNDAIAAVKEAKRLARDRAGKVGYWGSSQGGWVAPLAAKIDAVDFVIVAYGLAVSPIQEDREAIALDMTRQGYDAAVMAKAMEIADAIATIIRSDFRAGFDRLAALHDHYGGEPWFKQVHGDIAFFLLENPEAVVREKGPVLLDGIPADYDPMPVLRNLDAPQLWILGEDDSDAPSAETARRLRELIGQGKPITSAVFAHADHGIYEYETTAAGERVSTRNSDGYFAMMRDFILNGRIDGVYGKSMVVPAHPSSAQEKQ
jgi:pimeloyl-ACP methyl ester carboxylesterase